MKKNLDQAALLRWARRNLGATNEQLAQQLGKSLDTVLAWIAPKGTAKHRTMPKGSRLLLERLLAERRGRK